MAQRRTRDRRMQGLPSPGVATSKGFDVNTLAHVHRTVGPAVKYRDTLAEDYDAEDGPLVLQRTATVLGGPDDAPNTTAPTGADKIIGGGGCDEVVFFSAHDAATLGLGIEIWCRTDVHIDGTSGTAWVWVKVHTESSVQPYQEYRAQTGQRPIFVRVAAITGAGSAVVRATTA